MKQTVIEGDVKYEVVELRPGEIMTVFVIGSGCDAFMIGWKPPEGGQEFVKIEKNGEQEPGPHVYHPLSDHHNIQHLQIREINDGRCEMAILHQVEPKPDWIAYNLGRP